LAEDGGIVVGEAYRVDKDSVASHTFRADDKQSWGAGGKSPLLCFDASFGSTHGLVFAGSGGFKTTSVTIPTALKWGGGLVALDPSNEVAPMVINHRRKAGREVFVLSPKDASVGFNVLDWIGCYGGTKEEDVVAVASWVVTDVGRQTSMRDDFFRASALQLIHRTDRRCLPLRAYGKRKADAAPGTYEPVRAGTETARAPAGNPRQF
jgi:type IV secretion system protein VirD4